MENYTTLTQFIEEQCTDSNSNTEKSKENYELNLQSTQKTRYLGIIQRAN